MRASKITSIATKVLFSAVLLALGSRPIFATPYFEMLHGPSLGFKVGSEEAIGDVEGIDIDYTVLTSVVMTSSTGGGSASAGLSGVSSGNVGFPDYPLFVGPGLSFSGHIDVAVDGVGTASARILQHVSAQITNISDEDQSYELWAGYEFETFAEAFPAQGESLIYSWEIGVFSDVLDWVNSFSFVCTPTEVSGDYFDPCNLGFGFLSYGGAVLYLAPGESVQADMLMDVRAFVRQVPEFPSLPIMAAGLLVVAGLERRRRALRSMMVC